MKDKIIQAAVLLAVDVGYLNVTREAISNVVGCSPATINWHYKTMTQLKRAIMRHAIKNEVHQVIMQGIANNDAQIKKLTPEQKTKSCLAVTNL